MLYRGFWMVLFMLLYSPGLAQGIAPKYSNEFMHLGVGARALGMGKAQGSAVKDVTAGYWNPAGLLEIDHEYELSLMHAEYFAGIAKFDYAAFSARLETDNRVAVSLIRFGVDDISDTRFLYDANGALNYDNIQFFNAADYGLLLSFARHLSDRIKMGVNTKIIHRNVGKFARAWGFGIDVGGLFLFDRWRLGLMLRDISTTFNAWSHDADMVREVYAQTSNSMPSNSLELTLPRVILSISRDFEINADLEVQVVLDLDITFDGRRKTLFSSNIISGDPKIGLEAAYKKKVFFRAGAGNVQRLKDFDRSSYTTFQQGFGLGIGLSEMVQVDYALTDIGSVSVTPYSHIISIKVGLNPSKRQDHINKNGEIDF